MFLDTADEFNWKQRLIKFMKLQDTATPTGSIKAQAKFLFFFS